MKNLNGALTEVTLNAAKGIPSKKWNLIRKKISDGRSGTCFLHSSTTVSLDLSKKDILAAKCRILSFIYIVYNNI